MDHGTNVGTSWKDPKFSVLVAPDGYNLLVGHASWVYVPLELTLPRQSAPDRTPPLYSCDDDEDSDITRMIFAQDIPSSTQNAPTESLVQNKGHGVNAELSCPI